MTIRSRYSVLNLHSDAKNIDGQQFLILHSRDGLIEGKWNFTLNLLHCTSYSGPFCKNIYLSGIANCTLRNYFCNYVAQLNNLSLNAT